VSSQDIKLKIERSRDVLEKLKFSRSTLYLRIQQGLFVPPISLGGRAVGWLSHETNAVLGAYAGGHDKNQIKALVEALLASRISLFSHNTRAFPEKRAKTGKSEAKT